VQTGGHAAAPKPAMKSRWQMVIRSPRWRSPRSMAAR
jgi:hypothetical protein